MWGGCCYSYHWLSCVWGPRKLEVCCGTLGWPYLLLDIVWTCLFTPWRHGTWQTSCHTDQMASWRLTKFNCGKNSSSATVLWLVVQCWSNAGNSWTMCFMRGRGVGRCLKAVMGIKTDPNGRYSFHTFEKAKSSTKMNITKHINKNWPNGIQQTTVSPPQFLTCAFTK